MGRSGVMAREAAEVVRRAADEPGLQLTGLYSHLATADEEDRSFAVEQIGVFPSRHHERLKPRAPAARLRLERSPNPAIVDHDRYGGGGIYNFFCVFTAHNVWSNYLLLHEFGHSFAGLADEYYTSSVAYNEFYPKGIEPIEPNITALLDSENLKWKEFLSPGIDIPTLWKKDEYDRIDMAYQKKRREMNIQITNLKREGAAGSEVEMLGKKLDQLSLDHNKKVQAFFAASRLRDKVGAFEGAGYSSQGLYRPMLDCLMFTRGEKPYCKVCERAVVEVIKHLSK